MKYKLSEVLTEFKEVNKNSLYEPVSVGKYGIRKRNEIYKKELSDDYSKNKVIRKDNLIIGMGSNQIDVGVMVYDEIYSVSPAYHTYKINTSIVHSDYLELLFKSNNATYFKKYSVATARQGKKIDLKALLEEIIDIPSFEQQDILVSKISDIEDLITEEEKSISLLDELTKSRFIEMFGNKDGDISLDNLCQICRGASPRPISVFITKDPNGVNWIKIGDVDPEAIYITKTEEKITQAGASKSRRVYPGDFVLSNSMSFGRPYLLATEGCVHDGWLIISNYQKNYRPLFLYYLLRSESVQNQFSKDAGGTTVKNLNSDIVKKTKVSLYPLDIQDEFVEFALAIDKLKFSL